MQSCAVVSAHDVISDIGHRFIVAGIAFLPDPLHLQVQKEALHDSVDAPMSSRSGRVFQIGEDERVQLANDVALQATVNLLLKQSFTRAPCAVRRTAGCARHFACEPLQWFMTRCWLGDLHRDRA